MNGQNRKDIRPGLTVDIVLKADQPTGKLTRGIVQDILTSSREHHRGIKVRLTSGQVGRVQHIVSLGAGRAMARPATSKIMKIDIWADVVCPFCYIGEHELYRALQELSGIVVEVTLHSFELNHGAPMLSNMNLDEYLAHHNGISIEEAATMNADVTEFAASVGLTFDLAKTKPRNSFAAHRLVQFAQQQGLGINMMTRLQAAYFSEGLDITDFEILKKCAVEVGLDVSDVEKVLVTDSFSAEVKADQARATEMGITGVPFFLINKKYSITGAQSSESFLNGLRSVI